MDGSNDIEGIVAALNTAKASRDKPTFINCYTVIGIGSAVARDAKAHGAAFGEEDMRSIHTKFGFEAEERFSIPDKIYNFFQGASLPRGRKLVSEWEELMTEYCKVHPEEGAELVSRISGDLPDNWEDFIPKYFPGAATASRKFAGLVCNPLAQNIPSFMVGTADLSPSVYMTCQER